MTSKIYNIYAEANGFSKCEKIGCTTSIRDRIRAAQTFLPAAVNYQWIVKIEDLGYFNCLISVENYIHKQLENRRLKCDGGDEFFAFSIFENSLPIVVNILKLADVSFNVDCSNPKESSRSLQRSILDVRLNRVCRFLAKAFLSLVLSPTRKVDYANVKGRCVDMVVDVYRRVEKCRALTISSVFELGYYYSLLSTRQREEVVKRHHIPESKLTKALRVWNYFGLNGLLLFRHISISLRQLLDRMSAMKQIWQDGVVEARIGNPPVYLTYDFWTKSHDWFLNERANGMYASAYSQARQLVKQ